MSQDLNQSLLNSLQALLNNAAQTSGTSTPAANVTGTPTVDDDLFADDRANRPNAPSVTNTAVSSAGISQMASPNVLGGTSRRDGEPTGTRGPCKCGYKHWLNGEEKDFVFQIDTSKGPLKLGYNVDDNPYTVAEEFVSRHGLNAGSLNDQPLINAIANEIMAVTPSNANAGVESTTAVRRDPVQSGFDPFSSGFSAHSTKPAGNGEVSAEKSKEDEEKKKAQQEELKKSLKKQKEQEEEEKRRIKERMRLDQLEREAARKMQMEMRQSGGATNSQQPKPNLIRTPPRPLGGENTLSGPVPSSSSEGLKKSDSFDDIYADYGNKKTDGDQDDDYYKYDDDDDDDDIYADTKPKARPHSISPQPAAPPQKKMFSLQDLQQQQQQQEQHQRAASQQPWTMPVLAARYRQQGEMGLLRDLLMSGVNPAEARSVVSIIKLMPPAEIDKLAAPLATQSPSKPTFGGQGYTLAGSSKSAENVASTMSPPAAPLASLSSPAIATNADVAVDPAKPQTSIQIRLHNGAKLVASFNHHHTVGDIRSYIEGRVSIPTGAVYDLMLTYPKKVLSDATLTIHQAGLLNAVIVQVLR